MTRTKNKIPMVVNMSCEGEVQCPLCNEFFSLSLFMPQDCTSDFFECPSCLQTIGVEKDTIQLSKEIATRRKGETNVIEDINVIKRVQWHLDVPVCRILSGIKAHVAALSLKERMWLFYQLGGETEDELALIMRELIRLRRKHKRPLKAV